MDGEHVEFTQPSGTKIQLQVFGDEYYAQTRTRDGYTVVFDPASRAYCYARLSANGKDLISSGIRVGDEKPPRNLAKRISIQPESRRKKIRQRRRADASEAARARRWEAIKQNTREKREKKADRVPVDEAYAVEAAAAEEGTVVMGSATPVSPMNAIEGEYVGLMILVEFPDEPATISREDIDDFCNRPGYTGFGNDGSIRDYFETQSDGKVSYYNVVTPYVMAPHPKSYYNDVTRPAGERSRLLVNDVLQQLMASGFDFSLCTTDGLGVLDAVNLYFAGANSGVWGRGLWPHKSTLVPALVSLGGGIFAAEYQICNIGSAPRLGPVCHENGHLLLGYPDLYDYDFDSRGVGYYSLMGMPGAGTHPGSIDGYLRYHSGWQESFPIESGSHFRGCVRVDSGALYRFANPADEDEYFLLENRQRIGWESGSLLPDQGLLILHCDENGDRDAQAMTASAHYEVSIEQADGLFSLERNRNYGGAGDLFHSGYVDAFSDSTLPNAHWWTGATSDPASGQPSGLEIHDISANGETMTFIVGTGPLDAGASLGIDRSLLKPSASEGSSPPDDRVAVWNRGGGILSYSVASPTPWISLSTTGGTATTEGDLITISYHSGALGAGVHVGQIEITNTDNPQEADTVQVALTIDPAPQLSVSPSALYITDTEVAALKIANTGGGYLTYSLSGTWPFLSATNGTVGRETDFLTLTFDARGMNPGLYTGAVTVASPDAPGSPAVVPVTLNVQDLSFVAPLSGTYQIGEQIDIEWMLDPYRYPQVDIELFKDGRMMAVIADNAVNDGHYTWEVLSSLPAGTNYTLRVSSEGLPAFKESGPLAIYQYSDSFEDGFDGWVNLANDDMDWLRVNWPVGGINTGPASASDGNYYIYIRSFHPNYPWKLAYLSKHFDFGSETDVVLQFDYHMYGDDMGALFLDLYTETTGHELWARGGEQHTSSGSPWSTATVDLSPYLNDGAFDLQISGFTGDGYRSAMAVDNILLWIGTDSMMLTNSVPAPWLESFGLTADDATALLDSDGDGEANWAEYAAGTSPVDAGSVFRLTDVENATGGLVVRWTAENGKTYCIRTSSDLLSGVWAREAGGIPGVEPLCTQTVVVDHVTGFIRVEVEQE